MKKIILLFLAVQYLSATAQNLGDKTVFHAPMNGNYSDYGPAYTTGTANGGAVTTSDFRANTNQAVQLDGVNDYISYSVSSKYQPSFPISFSVWVYLDQLTGNFPVFATDNSTESYAGVFVQIANGTVFISYGDGENYGTGNRNSIQSATTLTAAKWYHIGGVIRGFNNMDLYIDGVKETSPTYSGSGSPMSMGYDGASLSIGMFSGKGVGANSYFKGKIDDLHIWNRELTAGEFKIKKNLILSYSMISGGTLEDDGPYGLQCENIGALYGTDRNGNAGGTFQMNGTSNYAKIPASNLYRTQFPVSVSAWVNVNSHKNIMPIFASSDHVNAKYSGLMLYLENGKPAIIEGDNQGAGEQFRKSYVANDSIKAGKWYHIVAVCTALGSTKLYLNGVEITNTTASGTGTAMVHGTGNGFMGYLSDPNAGPARYFNGSMDQIMVYGSALSPSEITAMYKPGLYFKVHPRDTAVQKNASVTLNVVASSTETISYQWFKKSGSVWNKLNTKTLADLSIASVTSADTGLYRCVISATNATDTSKTARITFAPLVSVQQAISANYAIYPNPANSIVFIEGINTATEINISTINGTVIYRNKVSENTKISVSDLLPGIYVITIKNNEHKFSQKLIKQH